MYRDPGDRHVAVGTPCQTRNSDQAIPTPILPDLQPFLLPVSGWMGGRWLVGSLSPSRRFTRRSYASVFIADIQVRFIIVPDLLAHAPMFKRVGPNAMRGRGIGAARGRATIQRAISRRGGQPRSQGVRR